MTANATMRRWAEQLERFAADCSVISTGVVGLDCDKRVLTDCEALELAAELYDRLACADNECQVGLTAVQETEVPFHVAGFAT